MFNSLSVNSVLFAMIMIAYCIQKYKTKKFEEENFDNLKVLSTFCFDDELNE